MTKQNQSSTFQGLPESPSKLSIAAILQIVIDLRKKRNAELESIKSSFNAVFNQWELIQGKRHSQGFIATKAKITIYAVSPPDDDRQRWEGDIQDELDELRSHHDNLVDEYQTQYREYRRSRKSKGQLDGDTTADLTTDTTTTDTVQKPTKLPEWNEDQVKNELVQTALDHRRNPTESIKTISLDFNGRVDADEAVRGHPAERTRRENLRKSKYIVKYFYNSSEMFCSGKLGLDVDFVLGSIESARIRSVDVPRNFKIQIFESGLIRDTFHGEFAIQLPAGTVTARFPTDNCVDFSNQRAIGEAGTVGLCNYSVFWGEDKNSGAILVPANLPTAHHQSHRDAHDPQMHIENDGQIDDPNDPEYTATGAESEGQIFSGFVLNPYLRDGFFASSEELDRNKRLRILKLRNEEVSEFRGRTMVPLKEHEIQDVEFQSYGKINSTNSQLATSQPTRIYHRKV